MSRIVGVTLLFIILVHSCYDITVLSAGLRVTKVHILKCRCKALPSGRQQCRYPLFPRNDAERQDLFKCFCKKANQHKFPEFQPVCRLGRYRHRGFPIALP